MTEKSKKRMRMDNTDGRRCRECNKLVRIAKWIVKCKDCEWYFHQKFSGASRGQLEGEVSDVNWRCLWCERNWKKKEEENMEKM